VAPAEEADELLRLDKVEELLCDLLVVLLDLPAHAWSAIAAAVPDELSERIDRYLDAV
jgi:hypothetical protein